MNSRRFLITLVAIAATAATPRGMHAADAPDYNSPDTTEKPAQWTFGTPEMDARPGLYYFYRGVEAIDRGEYAFAVDMYRTAASWAYKPAEYNLAVMYAKGEGVPVDKPLAMAWIALAAERGDPDLVEAREVIYATLSKTEFAKANEIWRELRKTYGDAVALKRAKARWAEVRMSVTGSRTGFVGNLRIGTSELAASPLSAFSMSGTVAYRQLRESNDPYDPKFALPKATIRVEPIVPVPQSMPAAPADPSPQHR